VVGCSYRGLPESRALVRNPFGGNMSFRRRVYSTCGGFRDGIGHVGTRPVGCEETEFCIRVRQNQPHSLVLYEPLARIAHRVPGTRTTWRYFRARCYAEGRSKAQVAHFVGARDGLATERDYTLPTLPLGVLRGMADAVQHRDASGLARAGAIVAGLALTTAGYLVGSASGALEYARQWMSTNLARIRPAWVGPGRP